MLKQALIYVCGVAMAAAVSAGQTQSASPGVPARPVVSMNDVAPITADVTLTVMNPDGTKQIQQGRYYRSHDGKIREDLGIGSVITDKKAGTITTLNPTTREAIVVPTPGPKGR